MTIYHGVGIAGPDGLIISIMAGAILGGVYSVYGAIVGGLFVALAQDLLKDLFYIFFGLSIESWAGLLPLSFLLTALMLFPDGFFGPTGFRYVEFKNLIDRLRYRFSSK
jgi:branched-subunit amino acid ABC-type transport system permease component